jgi:hypothetical protein
MKIDSLLVNVPERPSLSHKGGNIAFLPSFLVVDRLKETDLSQVSQRGAHLVLFVPSPLLLECFSRVTSSFCFEGSYLGQLTESTGLADYEHGGFGEHAVTELRITTRTDVQNGNFYLNLDGQLSPVRQSHAHWEAPKSLSAFSIGVHFRVAEAGAVFHGTTHETQDSVNQRFARLVNC